MPSYIGGNVLAAAAVLPATGVLMYFRLVHPAVLGMMVVLSVITLVYGLSSVVRYAKNARAIKDK